MANFDGINHAAVDAGCLGFWTTPATVDIPDIPTLNSILEAVDARIREGKKPAGILEKQLERIALHREQLADAVTKLFECYARMTAEVPHQRGSVANKARRDMLAAMPDKVLREFAKVYIEDVSEYILPDDRQSLEAAVLKAMASVTVDA